MPLDGLNHYNIHTSDLEGTKAFYCDVLGFKVAERPPFAFPGYWLKLGKVACLHLIGRDTATPKGSGAIDHIAFTGTGLIAMIERLKQLEVPMEHRRVPDQGLHQIFVLDPNGVKLELNYPAHEARALDEATGEVTRESTATTAPKASRPAPAPSRTPAQAAPGRAPWADAGRHGASKAASRSVNRPPAKTQGAKRGR